MPLPPQARADWKPSGRKERPPRGKAVLLGLVAVGFIGCALLLFDSCTGGPFFRQVDAEVAKAEEVGQVCEGRAIPSRPPYQRGRATDAATVDLDESTPLSLSLGGPATSSSAATDSGGFGLALESATVAICVTATEVLQEEDCSGYPLILSARIESRLVEVRTAEVLDTQTFTAGFTECPLLIPLTRSGAQTSEYDAELMSDATARAQTLAIAYHEGG